MHVLGDASLANTMAKIVIEMQYNKLSITFGQCSHQRDRIAAPFFPAANVTRLARAWHH